MKNFRTKNKTSGITLIALVVTIVVLLILASISIGVLTGENGIIKQAIEAKEGTEISEEREAVEISAVQAAEKDKWGEIKEENLETELDTNIGSGKYTLTTEDGNFIVTYNDSKRSYLVDADGNVEQTEIKLPEGTPEVADDPAFTRAYGVIEIKFLSGTSYNTTTTPNEPNMTSDMKKVYWENGVEKVEGEASDFDESKWYSYTAQTGATTSGGTSKWANAKTSDGSYWVWIPRYAYRIVYFDSQTYADAYRENSTQTTGIVGYSDARGIVDTEGKTPRDLQEPVTSIAVGENKLRPHPAFETDLSQGGWDSKLEGIWVAKYEMSQSGTTIKSTPGVRSYTSLKIGDCYTKSYDYDRNKESHLMKNSEWGAVVYLTESKYGRNVTTVSKNSTYYTAGASGATPTINPLQSTTGNEYGIFDTAGGAHEYVASYIADSSRNYGNSFASTDDTTNNKEESTKYATVYQMASSNSLTDNYNININKVFGDATTETSTAGTGATSWHSAGSDFVGINYGGNWPFFKRGGPFSLENVSPFYFTYNSGYDTSFESFRVCFAVK